MSVSCLFQMWTCYGSRKAHKFLRNRLPLWSYFCSQIYHLSLEHLLTINASLLLYVNFEIPHLCLYNQSTWITIHNSFSRHKNMYDRCSFCLCSLEPNIGLHSDANLEFHGINCCILMVNLSFYKTQH